MTDFIRPRPVAWFFFLAAFGTTLALGTWQVQRLHWKEALISTIEAAKQEAPLTQLPHDATNLAEKNFYPVSITGRWLGNIEFHVTPRFYKSTLGYFVITPLHLPDGRILLVNRGWVPTAKKDPSTRPDSHVSGWTTVDGLIRVGNERNVLTPPNQPDKNLWFGRDIEEMAASAKLPNPVPAMVDVVGEQDVNDLPVPSDGTIRLRNEHLSYIITWYGIALGILIIFIVYHRKKR